MKKSLLVSIILIFLVFLFIIIVHAEKPSKISANLKNITSSEKVRVFIKLKDSSMENETFLGFLKKSEKEKIKESLNKKIKQDFGKTLSAELSKKDIKNLESNDDIESIDLVAMKQIMLQDTVIITNATLTWPLLVSGINLTGKGETICIIDSGVNYSHLDLGGCYGNNDPSSSCKILGGYDYCADNALCLSEDTIPEDVNGHGTHVSGIASANGSINGIAPESKLIMIKVCNSSGSCPDDLVKAGIDWCVNNASIFNISAISISLGAGSYETYCDNIDDPFGITSSINSAVGKNISVIIASGNDGSSSAISSPACVQNVTPVSASTKQNVLASYSNRNSLVQLLAPGSAINSASKSGDYEVRSGTSMSAPHVAGAIAIINQFLKLTTRSKTPSQIESLLNSTGNQVYDSSSSRNYSIINIYSAVLNLDILSPNVSLISPFNSSFNFTQNLTFSCNASDWQLSNITFYLWNSTSIVNQNLINISGIFNQSFFNITNLTSGNYQWNCLASDLNGNYAFSQNNFTFTLARISTILIFPPNINYTSINQTNFTCNSQSESLSSLSNSTLYLWNSTDLIYTETRNLTGFSNSTIFNFTFAYEDSYKWNCLSYNNNSNSSFAENNFTIVYDIVSPIISLIEPADSSSYSSNSQQIIFSFNSSDNSNQTCNLVINDLFSQSKNVSNNSLHIFSQTFSPSGYSWQINCTDLAGNLANSSLRTFTVNSLPAQILNSGGGSSSSSSSNTYTLTLEQSSAGNTRELNKYDVIKFLIEGNEIHTLTVNNVAKDFVNLTIQSSPIKIVIYMGEIRKINLTSPKYYDLYLKLENIINNRANITIRAINEPIIINPPNNYLNNQTGNNSSELNKTKVSNKKNLLLSGILLSLKPFAIPLTLIFLAILILTLKKVSKLPKKQKSP